MYTISNDDINDDISCHTSSFPSHSHTFLSHTYTLTSPSHPHTVLFFLSSSHPPSHIPFSYVHPHISLPPSHCSVLPLLLPSSLTPSYPHTLSPSPLYTHPHGTMHTPSPSFHRPETPQYLTGLSMAATRQVLNKKFPLTLLTA